MELKICWYCQGSGKGSYFNDQEKEVIEHCGMCLGQGYNKSKVIKHKKVDNTAALKKAIDALREITKPR